MSRYSPIFFRKLYDKLPKGVRLVTDWMLAISFIALVALAFFIAILWLTLQARVMVERFLRERLVSNITSVSGQPSSALQVNELPTQTQTQTRTETPSPVSETAEQPAEGKEAGLVQPGENLVVSSFTDLFSGVGWLNQSSTTLYQDIDMTAFLLPPLFSWQSGAQGTFKPPVEAEDGTVSSCLQGMCLVDSGSSLSIVSEANVKNPASGVGVPLPKSVERGKLSDVSIGILDTTWLVGTVERTDAGYVGRIFFLPVASAANPSLTPVFKNNDAPFMSQYVGTIGFGGNDDDFLAVYGAYEGKGYRIHDGAVADVSRFFGIRVMTDGFYPTAVRSGGDWYVWSLTRGTPKFIKLFQNGTDEIVGGVDLTKELFSSAVDRAVFAPTGSRTFTAELTQKSGEMSWYTFVDKGFDKSGPREAVSANISNYPAEVVRAVVETADTFGYGGAATLFMRNGSGERWIPVTVGAVETFPNPRGRQLFWKMSVVPDGNQFTSPYLDTLKLGYAVKFL